MTTINTPGIPENESAASKPSATRSDLSHARHARKTPSELVKGELGKSIGSALCAIALFSLSFAPMTSAFAEPGNGQAKGAEGTDAAKEAAGKAPAKVGDESVGSAEKTETVYAFCQADGTTKSIAVSNELKNPSGAGYLVDSSTLENIENAEGSQEFTQDGEAILWTAQGDDIYYKGTTTKDLPLKLRATYYLDGAKVSAEQLAGATGSIKIRYEFINESRVAEHVDGANYQMYTPFMAASVFMFDNDSVSNVSIDNGKVVNDGDHSVVVGYALPGMQENLGVSKSILDVPSSFELSFDAENFSSEGSYTLVTPNLMNTISVGTGDLSSISSALSQLQDAMSQLIDGGTKIADGTGELKEKTASMEKGTADLNDGMQKLDENIPKMQEGAGQLADGTQKLQEALDLMRNGSDTTTGMVDAVSSIGDAADTSNSTLQGGLNQIRAGLAQLKGAQAEDPTQSTGTYAMLAAAQGIASATSDENPEGLAAGTAAATDGATQVIAGAAQYIALAKGQIDAVTSGKVHDAAVAILGGATQAKGYMDQATQAAAGAADAAGAAATAAGGAQGDVATASSSAASAVSSIGDAQTDIAAIATALEGIDTTGMTEEQIAQINAALNAQGAASASASDAAAAAGQAQTDIDATSEELGTAADKASAAATAAATAKAASTGASSAADAVVEGANNLKELAYTTPTEALDAATALLTGEGYGGNPSATTILTTAKSKLLGGIAQVNAYSSALAEGISGDGTEENPGAIGAMTALEQGLQAVQSALGMLRDGGTAPDGRTSAGLSGGVDALGTVDDQETLIGGTAALNNGAGQLSDGLDQAAEGVPQLADGTQQLADSAPALVDGIRQLADGAGQLSDGLKQFDEEGISKLVSYYENNIGDLGGRLKAIQAAGKDYRTFSGADANGSSAVSFIFKTDAIQRSE